MFSDRLEKYRISSNTSKRAMADKLDISESYYSLLVNNKRSASKKIISKLVTLSGKSETYWIYGYEESNLDLAVRMIKNEDLVNVFNDKFMESMTPVEYVLIKALKCDLNYILNEGDK